MIFHIFSRVAWSNTLALSPVLHAGCSVVDTWSPRNQRPNSTSPPQKGSQHPNIGEQGLGRLQLMPQQGTLPFCKYGPFISTEGRSHTQGGFLQQLMPS